MKLLYIQFKLFAKLPVIFEGGNKKERLFMIKYLSEEIMKQEILIQKIKPTTKPEEIINIITTAEKFVTPSSEINVFFDEINRGSKECIILLKEILLERYIKDTRISNQINLLASIKSFSVNKYNKYDSKDLNKNKYQRKEIDKNIISKLQVIPDSFFEDIYDFGKSIESEESITSLIIYKVLEKLEIFKKLKENSITKSVNLLIKRLFLFYQDYIQNENLNLNENENENENLSIFLKIFKWILNNEIDIKLENQNQNQNENQNQKENQKENDIEYLFERITKSILISLFVVYEYKFKPKSNKQQFFQNLKEYLKKYDVGEIREHFKKIDIQKYLDSMIENLIEKLDIKDKAEKKHIGINQRLKENIFFIFICCFSQIPLYIIGESGSSKVTSLEFILELFNQRDKENKPKFSLSFPHLKEFEIPSNKLIESNKIKDIFKKISKEIDENTINVITLKEINVLKKEVLITFCSEIENNELIKPSVIILSNSEFQLPILYIKLKLERMETYELEQTTESILKSFSKNIADYQIKFLVKILSGIYRNESKIISKQFVQILKGRKPSNQIYGIQDYYSFIKDIGYSISNEQQKKQFSDIYFESLFKHFGIRENILNNILKRENIEEFIDIPKFDLIKLLKEISNNNDNNNLEKISRHLMIFIPDVSIFSILYENFFNNSVLIFETKKENELNFNLEKIEKCVQNGETLVIFNYQKIYNAIYDLLKQNYKTYIYSSINEKTEKINIHPNFKLIIITSKAMKYEFNQPYLLSFFEKYYFDLSYFQNLEKYLNLKQKIETELIKPIKKIQKNEISNEELIIGYNENLIYSLILKYQKEEEKEKKILKLMKNKLIEFFKIEQMIEIYLLNQKQEPQKQKSSLSKTKKEIEIDQAQKKIEENIKYYFTKFERGFSELFQEEIVKKEKKKWIIITQYEEIDIQNIQKQNTDYSFQIEYLEKIKNKEYLIQKIQDEQKNDKFVLFIDVKQNEMKSFYEMKMMIDHKFSESNNNNNENENENENNNNNQNEIEIENENLIISKGKKVDIPNPNSTESIDYFEELKKFGKLKSICEQVFKIALSRIIDLTQEIFKKNNLIKQKILGNQSDNFFNEIETIIKENDYSSEWDLKNYQNKIMEDHSKILY
ncbi:hypothetical protein M0811_12805 [Anaeramoeba ignava]|uniref:Uncharacterized protein n=1 Tax=Anaeramoeba ignava TaxID=1746090 RepID=A0A9Q0R5A1_ANAIG|nr:hypothetical protein M0811_12805 [Anaeramoeba ignava]